MNAPVSNVPAPWPGRDDPRPRCYSRVDPDYRVVSIEWIELPRACELSLRELERAYFAWVPRISAGAVRPSWKGPEGPLHLELQPWGWPQAIRLAPAEETPTQLKRAIEGGLLAHPGGYLAFSQHRDGARVQLVVALVDFRPRLPRWLYLPTQRRLHVRSTYAFLREVTRRMRLGRPQPPGIPGLR